MVHILADASRGVSANRARKTSAAYTSRHPRFSLEGPIDRHMHLTMLVPQATPQHHGGDLASNEILEEKYLRELHIMMDANDTCKTVGIGTSLLRSNTSRH